MGERFAFIESNTTGTGILAVHQLLARGDEVVFFTRTPNKYPLLSVAGPGLQVVPVDTNDVDGMTARVSHLQGERPLAALLTFSEFYVPIVARVAERTAMRYLSPRPAEFCRDKFATRRCLAAAGLATPRFRLVSNEAEALAAGEEFGYPCIVKPPADSSSKGVLLVADAGELATHFSELHAWQVNDRGQRLLGHVLVESVLSGPEVSVETFTFGRGQTEVVGITAKHLSPLPHFVEVGHDFPAVLEATLAGRVESETLAALEAVGFDFGPAHTEVRLTPAGPAIVEINARLAGGMIPELVRQALGVDLLAAFLDLLCGRPVDLTPRREEWSSIRFLLADRSGFLVGVDGLADARRIMGVRDIAVMKALGAPVQPAREAADRLGHVVASGPERSQVLEAIDRAAASVRFSIEPARSGRWGSRADPRGVA